MGKEAHHHIKGLIGVVQQHVLLPDRGEHIAIVVADALGHARGELRPQKVGPGVGHQFRQIGDAEHAFDFDHVLGPHAKLAHDDGFQLFRGAGGMGQTHDLAPAAAFQGDFELAHEVFGLVFDLKIAVAQHAEFEMRFEFVARKEVGDVDDQQVFERQVAQAAVGRGQGYEAVDLAGDRQQCLQGAFVAAAFQLQRQRITGVRDEREGMCRINRQRRQHGEDLVEKDPFEMFVVRLGQVGGTFQHDVLRVHLGHEVNQHTLLGHHQVAGVFVDQHQLLTGAQPIGGGGGIARLGQFAQPRDPHGIEFIQIGG